MLVPHDPRNSPMTGDPLAPLVARVAAGDEDAMRSLYDATSARAYGMALRVLRDPDLAEEAALDAYTQVWRQADRFDPSKGSVEAWIAVLSRSRALDRRRRQTRQERGATSLGVGGGAGAQQASPHLEPLDESARDERSNLVRRALEDLPHEQRQAIQVAFFDGLTHTEVATALGAPLGTTKTRIRTGLQTLRRALADLDEEVA